jgi:hypothetical protein
LRYGDHCCSTVVGFSQIMSYPGCGLYYGLLFVVFYQRGDTQGIVFLCLSMYLVCCFFFSVVHERFSYDHDVFRRFYTRYYMPLFFLHCGVLWQSLLHILLAALLHYIAPYMFAGVHRCSFRARTRCLLFAAYHCRQQFFVGLADCCHCKLVRYRTSYFRFIFWRRSL